MKDEAKDEEADVEGKFSHPSSLIPHPLIPGEDFYTEGRSLVFTELYHLRRGYCCGSGCRHCPFRAGAGAWAGNLRGTIDAEKDSGL
jgi:hypothetical protein